MLMRALGMSEEIATVVPVDVITTGFLANACTREMVSVVSKLERKIFILLLLLLFQLWFLKFYEERR
jgi:hypothetical protein